MEWMKCVRKNSRRYWVDRLKIKWLSKQWNTLALNTDAFQSLIRENVQFISIVNKRHQYTSRACANDSY